MRAVERVRKKGETNPSKRHGPDWGIRFAAQWVAFMRRGAWLVIALSVVLTVAAGYYTALHMKINTNTADMLSESLPFRQTYRQFQKEFPQGKNRLIVVIDGQTEDGAAEAAQALAGRMESDTAHFRSVFYPQGSSFFRRNGLLYLSRDEIDALTNRLAAAQPLLATLVRDMSLRGLLGVLSSAVTQAAQGKADVKSLDPVLGKIRDAVEAQLAGKRYRLSWMELMRGDKPTPSDRRRIILAQAVMDWDSLKPGEPAMDAVQADTEALGLARTYGVSVKLTGSPALDTQELESVTDSAGTAGVISIVLVLGLLVLGLRSVRLVVATLFTLLAGLVWTAAFALFAVGSLNMISVAFAVLFIGLGADFGIHFALRYREERAPGLVNEIALRRTAAGVGGALVLCAVAAAISFFSFIPTAYRGVSELGLIAGVGMFIALVANFTLLPALLTVLPGERDAGLPGRGGIASAIARGLDEFILTHRRAIMYGALVLAVAGGVLGARVHFDFNPLNLKDPTKESVKTLKELMANSDTTPETISVVMPDLEKANAKAQQLSKLSVVDKAVTLSDYVPENQEAKLAAIDSLALFLTPVLTPGQGLAPPTPAENRKALDDFRQALERFYVSGRTRGMKTDIGGLAKLIGRFDKRLDADPPKAPIELAALQKSLLAYLPSRIDALRDSLDARRVTIDDLPKAIRDRMVAPDGHARIEVYPASDVSDNTALRRFVEGVETVAPNATDSSVILLRSGDAIVHSFQKATAIALALILVLLAALLRNVWDVTLVLVPIGLAALYTVGFADAVGLSFNFANVIVLPLLLGLGVASAIHLVMRGRDEALSGRTAKILATSTPRAVTFSALTTIGSFGSLAVSPHRGMASLGALLTIAIAMTLLCVLIVLPAMMEIRKERMLMRGSPRRRQTRS